MSISVFKLHHERQHDRSDVNNASKKKTKQNSGLYHVEWITLWHPSATLLFIVFFAHAQHLIGKTDSGNVYPTCGIAVTQGWRKTAARVCRAADTGASGERSGWGGLQPQLGLLAAGEAGVGGGLVEGSCMFCGCHPHCAATCSISSPAHTHASRLHRGGSERWQRGDTLPSRFTALGSRRGRKRRTECTLTHVVFIPPLARSRRKDRRPQRVSMPMWWGPPLAPVLRTSLLTARPSRKARRNWSGKCPPQDRSGARWEASQILMHAVPLQCPLLLCEKPSSYLKLAKKTQHVSNCVQYRRAQ